jgi:hypothetical protein
MPAAAAIWDASTAIIWPLTPSLASTSIPWIAPPIGVICGKANSPVAVVATAQCFAMSLLTIRKTLDEASNASAARRAARS